MWQFMNYGYLPHADAGESPPDLQESYEFQRFPLQMYHFLALKGPIDGKDVLEVGSGRGGGANYLYHHHGPSSYTAIDYAEEAIRLSSRRYMKDNLRFQKGDAENLPFENAQFDIVINVESSFLYPNFTGFLKEVQRVLRPGGRLLLADFRWAGEMDKLENDIQKCGFKIASSEDISLNVLNSLDLLDGIYAEKIDHHVPWYIRRYYKQFSASKGSAFYEELKRGDRRYFRYVLEKA
jgi:ubiquinone/menaquinone biosynthesis C-methylase UbiE